jgi:hypothetical protein
MTPISETQAGWITKQIGGDWLRNGHLEVCLLKLAAPEGSQWENDESRSENLGEPMHDK